MITKNEIPVLEYEDFVLLACQASIIVIIYGFVRKNENRFCKLAKK
jgi:hypothetical protein